MSYIYNYRDNYFLEILKSEKEISEYLYNPQKGVRMFMRTLRNEADMKTGIEEYIKAYEKIA